MIQLRKSNERGHANHGWLDSYHTFSFADYYDPQHMAFRSLRVINEDRVAPGAGFPTHPHRDMEIVTYVVSGAVAHRDSTGGNGIIAAGDLQHMTAGSGVQHSEFNHSKTDPVHLLQIWITPASRGLTPGYDQTSLRQVKSEGPLKLAASPEGGDGVLKIHQDARILVGQMQAGEKVVHALETGRHAWVQLIEGKLTLNGQTLVAGDAAAVSEETALIIGAEEAAHFLVFDLA
jgi:redox-sensitive bicupin YhaK (pirin superfamily)